MKRIDLFIGIRAEQTLRDAVRDAAESELAEGDALELCPVGKKDWVAGQRHEDRTTFGQLDPKLREVVRRLIELQSHQRIRHESIRVYAVRKPVPAFKDPAAEEASPIEKEETMPSQSTDVISCPVCHTQVHRYNIQHDPRGKAVGCYLCRGEKSGPGGSSF